MTSNGAFISKENEEKNHHERLENEARRDSTQCTRWVLSHPLAGHSEFLLSVH